MVDRKGSKGIMREKWKGEKNLKKTIVLDFPAQLGSNFTTEQLVEYYNSKYGDRVTFYITESGAISFKTNEYKTKVEIKEDEKT